MAVALESAADLVVLLLWAVAWGLLALLSVLVSTGRAHLNPSLPVVGRPLDFVYREAEHYIGDSLQTAANSVSSAWHGLLNGLQLAFALIVLTIALPVLGTRAALEYLWNHALLPYVRNGIADTIDAAKDARAFLELVRGEASTAYHGLTHFVETKADAAYQRAVDYVETPIRALRTQLRAEIQTAEQTAERYADNAVAALRTAEDAAIGSAVAIAHAATAAAAAAVTQAVSEAESFAVGEAAAVETDFRAALAAADAAGKTALDVVRSVAVTAEQDIHDLIGSMSIGDAALLLASIPALATLVHAIAVESGLENAECRGKVKGICGTNPASWAQLLGGLAVLGVAFDLRALYGIARPLVEHLAPVIREAA